MPGILGLITARGGSKGIPGKNIASLAGRPLIAWTIEAALRSQRLTHVIVSTDDPEIAQIARDWGAEVPFRRPAELARDDSPHLRVVLHAVNWLRVHQGLWPDYVVLLQPTSPLRTEEDIDTAMELAREKHADAVVSVCPSREHPCLSKTITPDGRLMDFGPLPEGYLRRQVLPQSYSLNGAIFLARRDVLLEWETWYTESTFAYVMPPERSLDIDTAWDLYLADLILGDRVKHENY